MANLLEITRGDDKVWILTVSLKSDGTVTDITGCTVVMTLRETPDGAVFKQKTSATPGQIDLTDPTHGVAEITFAAADTSSLTNVKHEYLFDVQITKPTGKIETIAKGKLTVLPDITHA